MSDAERVEEMRILLLAQFYPPIIGGEERHVFNLATELAVRGHDVHVGTFKTPGRTPAFSSQSGVNVHELTSAGHRIPALYQKSGRPMAMPMPDPVLTAELYKLARAVDPHVVHAHNWIVNSYLPIKHRVGAPLVLSLHDYSHVCATKRLMREEQPCEGPSVSRCSRCATAHYKPPVGLVTWISTRAMRPLRERLVDRFTPVSTFVAAASGLVQTDGTLDPGTEVVPNFIPDNLNLGAVEPRDASKLPDEPFFFFAGDLNREKGLQVVIDAYKTLPEPRLRLLAVGRRTSSTPVDVPDGISIEAEWEHTDVLRAFRACTAAVLPSVWPDPCPTTVLEALGVGAPLITTHMGGIADMVQHGVSALVTEPGNVNSLASAMQLLQSDNALRDKLRAGGLEASMRFRCGSVTGQLETIYSDLVKGKAESPKTTVPIKAAMFPETSKTVDGAGLAD